jgi:hypothetical protein
VLEEGSEKNSEQINDDDSANNEDDDNYASIKLAILKILEN